MLSYTTNINRQGLLDATNEQRQAAGSKDLSLSQRLSDAAQKKAEDMNNRNYWSHQTPEGEEPWRFISQTGYSFQSAGENLAYGFSTNQDVINGWLQSPAHRANLLSRHFSEVGFGIIDSSNFDNRGPSTIVVAIYASPQPISATTNTDPNYTLGSHMTINKAQLLAGSGWVSYLIGFGIGAAIAYLGIAHGKQIRKSWRKGERFIINHPLLDSVVIALVAAGIFMLRAAGTVL